MKLFVVRHGQTDYNAQRRFQGQSNIPLNQIGQDQARRAGLVLSQLITNDENRNGKYAFAAIQSSDLKRTKETCEIICTQLKSAGQDVQAYLEFDSRLREFHCGLFENFTYEEFVSKNPEIASSYMTQFDQDTYATRYPGDGGESRLDVMSRVGKALRDAHEKFSGQNVLWVVHGGVIDVLLELTHIQTNKPKSDRISAGNGDVLVIKPIERGEQISSQSVSLGHVQVWQLERHYRIGDTVAARVVR